MKGKVMCLLGSLVSAAFLLASCGPETVPITGTPATTASTQTTSVPTSAQTTTAPPAEVPEYGATYTGWNAIDPWASTRPTPSTPTLLLPS